MNTRNPHIIGAALLMLVACGGQEDGDRDRTVAAEPERVPVVQTVDGGQLSTVPVTPMPPGGPKVLVADMQVDAAGGVALRNVRVQYGEAPNDLGNPPMFDARLIDSTGRVIDTRPLWDPRWTFVWSDDQDRDFVDLGDAAEVAVVFPFDRAAVTVAVIREKERLASIDVAAAIAEFCAKYRDDADCRDREPREPVQ